MSSDLELFELLSSLGAKSQSTSAASKFPPLLWDTYYHPHTKDFYIPGSTVPYVKVSQSSAERYLISKGVTTKKKKKAPISDLALAIIEIQTRHSVDYVGPLAGHKAGYYPEFRGLVTESPEFVEPAPGVWPTLGAVFENLFGPTQLPYFYGWLHCTLRMYQSGNHQPGQAIALAGPRNSGKTLVREIITQMFGGEKRVGHPYSFMTEKTHFNSDLFRCEILVIDDAAESRDIRIRRHFGAQIKQITANADQWCHGKNLVACNLRPLWRLLINLNDESERLMVLPPIEDDIADKIMLFKVEKHPMPMATDTPEDRRKFFATLIGELPAFASFLQQWTIDPLLTDSRFGIRAFHHPDILKTLTTLSPEMQLLEMIDEVIFGDQRNKQPWDGRANQLARSLKDKSSTCSKEAEQLLAHLTSCGTYLGRLERKLPKRIKQRCVNGQTIWTILPPDFMHVPPAKEKHGLERLRQALEIANAQSKPTSCAVDVLPSADSPQVADKKDEPSILPVVVTEEGLVQESSLVIQVRLSPPIPTHVFDTYWEFAAERQELFYRKIQSPYKGPWTNDPILAAYKFTNAYRASDRVSQYLIRNVIYAGDANPEELFFRTILFKIFNRIETWELLAKAFGEISWRNYSFAEYDRVLTAARNRGRSIFSGAYMMTAGKGDTLSPVKHQGYLRILENMMKGGVPAQIAGMKSLEEVYRIFHGQPFLGDFLAFQYAIDLNYSPMLSFSEMDYVVAGPGAINGIAKCFSSLGGYSHADLIRLITDQQQAEFEKRGIRFRSLWGRPLHLIDSQNLFCEVDKISRVKHPEVLGPSKRHKIKTKYQQTGTPIQYWYPPKWGLNDLVAQGVPPSP